jgi:hypothetical protein
MQEKIQYIEINICMEDINDRFLRVYDYLKFEKKVKNAKDFAKKVDTSSSFMTEIKKNRSSVGIEIIQNTVRIFDVNAEWLLTGNGEMLKKDEVLGQKNDTGNENFLKFLHEKTETLNKKIWDLEAENKNLKAENIIQLKEKDAEIERLKAENSQLKEKDAVSARKRTIDLEVDNNEESKIG